MSQGTDDAAVARRMTPAERRQRQRTGTAYHEAGHAIAAYFLDRRFHRVTIVPNDEQGSLGHLLFTGFASRFHPDQSDTPATHATVRDFGVICFAGPLAAIHQAGRGTIVSVGGRGDVIAAGRLASYVCYSDAEERAYIGWLEARAHAFITSPQRWPFVVALAGALVQRETLSRAETRALIVATSDALMQAAASAR